MTAIPSRRGCNKYPWSLQANDRNSNKFWQDEPIIKPSYTKEKSKVIISNKIQTFRSVAAAPPNNSTGDSAIWAFFTAVTVFVRPDMITINRYKIIHLPKHTFGLKYRLCLVFVQKAWKIPFDRRESEKDPRKKEKRHLALYFVSTDFTFQF